MHVGSDMKVLILASALNIFHFHMEMLCPRTVKLSLSSQFTGNFPLAKTYILVCTATTLNWVIYQAGIQEVNKFFIIKFNCLN